MGLQESLAGYEQGYPKKQKVGGATNREREQVYHRVQG